MRLRFILLIIFQLFLLTGIIAYREYWVATGERILLKTVPVDPRDMFRGDYVQLSYEISNLDLNSLSTDERFMPNDKVYVILERNDEGTYSASSMSRSLPSSKTFIQGRARYETQSSRWAISLKNTSEKIHILAPQWFCCLNKGERIAFCLDSRNNVIHYSKDILLKEPLCDAEKFIIGTIEDIKEVKFRQLNVEYGIESYFVEEGKGRAIEAAQNANHVKVEVSLRKDGKGIITRLLLGSNCPFPG